MDISSSNASARERSVILRPWHSATPTMLTTIDVVSTRATLDAKSWDAKRGPCSDALLDPQAPGPRPGPAAPTQEAEVPIDLSDSDIPWRLYFVSFAGDLSLGTWKGFWGPSPLPASLEKRFLV